MSELLYIKYNSHRRPEYQISTRIVSNGKTKKVIKCPISDKAGIQIETLKDNYKKLKNYYKSIDILPFKVSKEIPSGLEFKFVEGASVLSGVNFEILSLEHITKRVISVMDELLDVRDEYLCEFSETEDFQKVFLDCHPKEGIKAFKICNLDSIFSNFIRTDKSIVCLDYEWVLEFPVPVDFVRYRMMRYLYDENTEFLKDKASFEEFSACLELTEEDRELYADMEMKFQYMVHGENVKYIYLENYKKRMLTSEKAYQLIDSKDEHIANLDENIEHLNEDIKKLDQYIEDIKTDYGNIIESKDTHIGNLNSSIDSLNKTLEEKDTHIRNLDGLIEKQSEEIAEKDTMVSDRDELIQNLKDDNSRLYEDLMEHSRLLGEKIDEVRALTDRVTKLHRCIKNPVYGAYSVAKYIPRKIKREVDVKLEEKRKIKEEQQRQLEIERKAEADKRRFEELLKISEGDYESWIERREAEYEGIEDLDYRPLISIVVPVYNVEDRHLIPCIESVKNQTYGNYELILVDDCSTYENIPKTLKKKSRWNKKIRICFREENGGISACTNTGIEMAQGEYIAFMDCDDTLAPFALYEVVKKLNEEEYDFVYSDEDKIDDDGTNRHTPFFKPDWSPDTLMSYMYTSHFGVYKASMVKELGGLNSEFDGCQDYDFTLRFTEKTEKIGHVPKVLYHWRERKESTASNPEAKDYVKARTKKCKEAALARRNLKGDMEWLDGIYQYRVRYSPQNDPFVSIIIPSKDNPKILEQCLSSLSELTAYKNYEVTIVDNGSSDENREKYEGLCAKYRCRYHYEKKDFNFSYMCNVGARISKGEYFLFLNDDIEIIEPEWLDRMLGQACLPHVGAVGAKLLYPNTIKIQHTGVISIESGPVHEFAKMDDDKSYYFNRNKLDFDVLAVTAACLLVRKSYFEEIGGFDENLAVAYNDIDLCFKLIEHGYFNVIRNDAVLYHHESISRGDDAMDPAKFARLMSEQDKLYEKHPKFKGKDPFYSVNLTQTDCDFSNNYDADNHFGAKPVDSKRYEVDETIRYGVDVARNDWCLYIEGWAFKEGFDDNINLETKVVLVSDEMSYALDTVNVRREDVVSTFSNENCISFCGYKTRLARNTIKSGKYEIYILCNGKIASREKANDNSKEFVLI